MMVDLDLALQALRTRGIELRATDEYGKWKALEDKWCVCLSADLRELYSKIDGFVNYDFGSQFRLWSVDEIVRNITNRNTREDGSMLISIGDFLLESDQIVTDINKNDAEIKLLNENSVISENLNDFIFALGAGSFDFL